MPYATPPDSPEFIVARSKVDENGCWVWQLSLDRHGYALLAPGAHERLAHRLSYRLFKGDIPDGLTVDHMCFVTNCVNPDHLQVLTMGENARRKMARPPGQRHVIPRSSPVVKTHCKRGHEYTPETTRLYAGKKHCVPCQRARRREKRVQ